MNMNFNTIDLHEIISRAELYTTEMWEKEDERAEKNIEMGIAPEIARERANKLWAEKEELYDWLVGYGKRFKRFGDLTDEEVESISRVWYHDYLQTWVDTHWPDGESPYTFDEFCAGEVDNIDADEMVDTDLMHRDSMRMPCHN